MPTLSTSKERYEELQKNPLLFLCEVDHSYEGRSGNLIECIHWAPIDTDFYGEFDIKEMWGNRHGYALAVADGIIVDEKDEQNKGNVCFSVHAIDMGRVDDWLMLINSFIIRSKNKYDKFPYIHLLWALNYCQWDKDILVQALSKYDKASQKNAVNNGLCKIGRCLSSKKQQYLQQMLSSLGYKYEPYSSLAIQESVKCVSPWPQGGFENTNLFCMVDWLLKDSEQLVTRHIPEDTRNPYLCLYHWLQCADTTIDHSMLAPLLSVSPNDIQLRIIKRYFHDIRTGKATLSFELLSKLRDNEYSCFTRYRYCLETPERPIDIAVPLLCDCLLTLHQTLGKSFQTFDGLLDFAVTHCDVTKPSLTLGLEKFLPQCDGGAVYNSEFKGFIDYEIVCELDESKFTEQNLIASIRRLLDQRPHLVYDTCAYDEKKRPLTEEEKRKCFSTRTFIDKLKGQERVERKYNCTKQLAHPDKWVAYEGDYEWLNTFLIDPLPKAENNQYNQKTIIIDINQTSTEVMANYIRSLTKQLEQTNNNRFVVPSDSVRQYYILLQYSKPLYSRFIPQSKAIAGIKFDVFGVYKALCQEHNLKCSFVNASDETKAEFKKREAEEIRKRIVETMKQELKVESFNGSYFEVPYEKGLHHKILGLYYYKGTIPDSPLDSHFEFLKKRYLGKFKPFCAPQLAKVYNQATGLPFFWCAGNECFHNNLNGQTLQDCTSWPLYSLFHLTEIMGLPMLKETEAGLEPRKAVCEFIACANRAIKKFRRLKCRSCGHLLYTDKSSGYNRYNYYVCVNPDCKEHNHPIYLSYCFECKKELIDSRDSAQCPNGWYICPKCLSCCNDAQYERLAQRYIISNQVVPERIQGKLGCGHNDKGVFFCPSCGKQLEYVDSSMECPQCGCRYMKNKNCSQM